VYSPLKEMSGFNRYVNTLKVKMAPRVWKTGIIQESKPRRISPNSTIFPPARGGETEKGKRDSSLKSMVKLSDIGFPLKDQ
jgi:hypothetical protein